MVELVNSIDNIELPMNLLTNLLVNKKFNDNEKRFLIFLIGKTIYDDEYPILSKSIISRNIDVSERTVFNMTRRLQQKGYLTVEVEELSKYTLNRYIINFEKINEEFNEFIRIK